MFARFAIGLFLILHGLMHARPGMLASGDASLSLPALLGASARITSWLSAPLLAVAMAGFVAAGFGAWGAVPFRRWRTFALVAAIASLALLGLFPADPVGATGAALNAVILVALLHTRATGRETAEIASEDADGVQGVPTRHPVWRGFFAVIAVCIVLWTAAVSLFRPSYLRWGASDAQIAMTLPGDDAVRDAAFMVDHSVLIDAPVDQVWPWLAQIGEDRGGFYSYAWLENLFGLRITNADRIHPEWQAIAAGDFVRATPPGWLGLNRDFGWRVESAVPNDHIALQYWGTFALECDPGGGTRLHVRTRTGRPPLIAAPVMMLFFEPSHFIMQREMMLGIKRRAERTAEYVDE